MIFVTLSIKSINSTNHHLVYFVEIMDHENESLLNFEDSPSFSSLLHLLRLRLVLDFDLLVYAFGQFPLVVCTWICMFLSALLVPYSLFYLWSQTQSGSYSYPRLCTLLFSSVFLLYQALGLGFLPTYVVVTNSLPPASCFIIILEQVDDHIQSYCVI